MAIQFYTGTGGTHALFRKLAEVWSFTDITSDNGEVFSDPSASGGFKLWITDEVYLHYSASEGWADAANPSQNQPCLKHGACATWKIVRTECGVAFGDGEDISIFIGRTIGSDGTQSFGVVARQTSSANGYFRITDGMTVAQDAAGIQPLGSVHYTQLSNVVPVSVPVYFPDIYQVNVSPQTTNRVAQIGADIYYCTQYIAIRDTAAASGSVDLSGYYNAAQTDAKIKAVETVLSEEIAAVSEAVRASERARTQSIKVYVSPSGSDSNDGTTSGTAFATLGGALEATAGYGMTEIQLAAGEYDFPESQYYVYSRDLRITGAGKELTTLYGKLYAHDSNFELKDLTLDGIKNTNTGSAPLTVAHGATVRVENCVVNAPTSGNGIYVTAMGHLFVNASEIKGFSTRMLYLTIDAEAVLSNVTCTTTATAENIMAGATALLRMVDCPDLTYTTQYAGIVFVDGVQRSPVDITTVVVQASEE